MNSKLRVYTLSGYSEELIAVAFAKTSRSPESFDKIAKELDEVKSSKFHERWVLNYGHGSVAEHAILHIAVENASRLAIDVLNSRLASYTEKSTRYQVITPDLVYIPEFIENNEKEKYLETVKYLFDSYKTAIEELTKYFEKTISKEMDPKKREMEIKLKAIDNARFLLPLSTFGNIGITINARSLEHTLKKMFSCPLREVQDIAKKIKEEGLKETPTLLKYTEKTDYLTNTPQMLEDKLKGEIKSTNYSVKLVDYEKNGVEKIIAAILYKFSGLDYESAINKAKTMSDAEKEKLIDSAIGTKGEHDAPIRELEHINYTFDLVMDFGAYYEFKRHRMCSMSVQKTGASYGYYIPEDFKNAGLLKLYEDAMKKSDECYKKLKEKCPNEAEYICTNAHYKRVLATMNLRELYHFIKLRGSPYAHFTIRIIAKGMQKELKRVHPLLIKHLKDKEC